jgi:deoxyribonuclease I
MKNTIYLYFILNLSLNILPQNDLWAKNVQIKNYQQAKTYLFQIHGQNGLTVYCNCQYLGDSVDHQKCGYKSKLYKKRSTKLEWEHIVPAHAFGQAFKSWREGDPKCINKKRKFKGRKCAKKIEQEFNYMEADLYNLWPVVGSINAKRSNYSMAQWTGDAGKIFGACPVKINDRKIEPPDRVKGLIARIYQYMDQAYPGRGIISKKNKKLYEAWDKLYPVTIDECNWANKVKTIQGNAHIIEKTCQDLIINTQTSEKKS